MQPFIFRHTVLAGQIDQLGHMHYLQHRVIAEKAHVQLLDNKNVSLETMMLQGYVLHMREDSASYNKEVKLGDILRLEIEVSLESIACLRFRIRVFAGETEIVVAEIDYKMVTLSKGSPCPVKKTPFIALVA